jgi:PAS domain S-box-containing protein
VAAVRYSSREHAIVRTVEAIHTLVLALTTDSQRKRVSPEEQARTILESVTDAFFHIDRDFCFTYLNGTARRLLQRDDLVGKHIWTEFPAARGSRFQRAYERAMNEAERVDFVEYYPAPLDRWYDVRAYPSVDGVSVYFHDITEKREAEAQYQRKSAQLELIVRGANVGVWYCPLPFDELIWDAKVKEHFFLAPEARVTIETFYERLHPDDRGPTREAIRQSVEQRTHYDVDYRTVSPDGSSLKWIRAMGRAFYDAEGAPVRFDGVTMDVSERKQAELALRASEERYRLATRATADVIWDYDLTNQSVRWNESLASQFGWSIPEETPISFWLDNIHPDDRERVQSSLSRLSTSPGSEHWEEEYAFMRKDGSWADVLDRGFVLRDPAGRALRIIGAKQDLSARKRVERDRERMLEAERAARAEAERQSRMKDEFLTTISHELRTPLNAILGWSELLSREPPDEKPTRALDVILRNARAQKRIIEDLLDMSQMLSGNLRLDLHRLDLRAVLDAAHETAKLTADAKKIHLSFDQRNAAAFVLGDAARLQQVIWNLLANAIKFTPSGGQVDVSLELDSEKVRVVVSDDGEGISSDFLPHVFDRFRQADGSISRRHGGLGLGLSIVKQIVELHGGAVFASSDGKGLGSRFVVELPLASPPLTSEQAVQSAKETVLRTDLSGLRVLVVDDELDARTLIARVLEQRGAQVLTAASAAQAYEICASHAPLDVLVSDIGMPGEDGYALLRRVRALGSAKNAALPAVAVTAYTATEERARAVSAGFRSYVTKPFDVAELCAMIAAATGRLGD